MSQSPHRIFGPAIPFLLAAAAVSLGALLRWLITPALTSGVDPFITFFPAVAFASWYGGLWPGVLAVVLSFLLADWYWIPPYYSLGNWFSNGTGGAELALFACMAGAIVALGEAVHRSERRIQAEADVAARRGETLRITLASIGDGVIAVDATGRVTFMNAVAERLTGWTESEAQGEPLTQVFHIINERTRETVENPTENVLRTGRIEGLANHTVLVAKGGDERPIDDSAAPICDANGNILGVVLVFRDATQHRQAQAALQQLAAIVEHSNDAVIGKNRDGFITSWNAAAERLYGYAAAEMVGRHIGVIVPAERQQELTAVMERLWRGETIEHFDTVRLRKDGSRVEVSLRISPIKDPYGEVIGASKVARDVTDRKRDERALRFLADISAALAALVDRDSALQQAAEAMAPFFSDYCVIYVAGPHGAVGKPVSAHRDEKKQQLLSELLQDIHVDQDSRTISARAWRDNQTQLFENLTEDMYPQLVEGKNQVARLRELAPRSVISVPLRVRERTIGIISFIYAESGRRYRASDVTLAEELARRVAVAVDNATLLASVREADRQKDEFLAMLAHELRNPLAAIRYAADAARLPDQSPTTEILDVIDRQVSNLAHLIDDLLDLSRISRDKIQLRREPIDAAIVARRAVATVRPQIEEKRHCLEVHIDERPMPLIVDPTRVEQIVVNLLSNAAKYTPDEGRITLKVFPDGDDAVISVGDTGIGISKEVLPFVFDLFAQADQALDRSQGGLGIGLTVARNLAEMHGGTIAGYSEGVGRGAQFTVCLPLAKETFAPAGDSKAPPPTSQRLKVLVVDDNRDTATVEALLLKKWGHEVAVAHDGQAALETAGSFRPDAVLLDIGLPVLNGYEVASRLRRDGFAHALLIGVSGYGQKEDQERSRQAGFDHHLVKPVDTQALMTLLSQFEKR